MRSILAVAALVNALAAAAAGAQSCGEWTPGIAGMDKPVFTFTVFDDGSGPALYAGGQFASAGTSAARFVAKRVGNDWVAVGDDLGKDVYALAAFDDGTGPALFAGGQFERASGGPADHVARFDGSAW